MSTGVVRVSERHVVVYVHIAGVLEDLVAPRVLPMAGGHYAAVWKMDLCRTFFFEDIGSRVTAVLVEVPPLTPVFPVVYGKVWVVTLSDWQVCEPLDGFFR